MGRAVEAFLAMVPPTVTHNSLTVRMRKTKDGTVPYVGKSDALREAEDALRARLSRVRPQEPLRGPLRAQIRWCFPTDGRHPGGEPHQDSPDLDNLEKTFLDCCQAEGIIENDARIADKRTTKAWSDPAGIWFRFETF